MIGWFTVIVMVTMCTGRAIACRDDAACRAEDIDRFFLPLIAASLMHDVPSAALNRTPGASPVVTSDLRPVVIKPPAPPPAAVPVPVLKVRHQLVAGDLAEGGSVRLDVSHTRLPKGPATSANGAIIDDKQGLPPLRHPARYDAVWQMQHTALLPAVPSWPLEGLFLPIEMRLTCGACGPGGAVHHFNGTAELELLVDDIIIGWIDNIDLVASDGMTATGFLNFSDTGTGGFVLEDHLAEMFLKIGEDDTNFQGDLYAWMNAMMHLNGALAMVPTDRLSGIGAVAGQFSGAPCAPDCGVEN